MRRRAGRGAAGATATAAGGLKVAANHTTGHCMTLHGSSDRATGDWHHLRVTARRWVGRSAPRRRRRLQYSLVRRMPCIARRTGRDFRAAALPRNYDRSQFGCRTSTSLNTKQTIGDNYARPGCGGGGGWQSRRITQPVPASDTRRRRVTVARD